MFNGLIGKYFFKQPATVPHHCGQLDHTGSNTVHGITVDGNPSSPDEGIESRFSVLTSLEGRCQELPFATPPGPPPVLPAPPGSSPLRPPPPPPSPPISELVSFAHEADCVHNMLQSVFVAVNMPPPQPHQLSGERKKKKKMSVERMT